MELCGRWMVRRIIKGILVSVALASAVTVTVSSVPAQESPQREGAATAARGALDSLTRDEESAAERIARSDKRVQELLGERGVRLVSATPVMIKRGESPEKFDVNRREIEVVLFRPEGEVGARVLVNLRQNSVASVQRLAGNQVPLTFDDLNDAFQLALRDPQVQRALGPAARSFRVQSQGNATAAAPSENIVTGLPIRSNDPKDPCSKHRCLQLFFRRGTDFLSEPVVTVDLTAKHVSIERRQSQ